MMPDEIKVLRAKLGMTQEQLAHELGVSFATVNRWENGHSSPKGIFLKALQALDQK